LLEGVRRDTSGRFERPDEPKPHADPWRHHNEKLAEFTGLSSWWATVTTWRFFSLACGFGAVLTAILIWLLPSNEWRAAVGGLVGLGLLVFAFMLSMNPTYFYRRTLSYVIPAGLLLNALGFTVDVIAPGGRFQWNGAVSGWFFVAWAVVVSSLILGDLKQSR
jgi:hypothetical protein